MIIASLEGVNKYGLKENEDVAILEVDNFYDVIENHAYTLVEFYTTWCPKCKQFATSYSIMSKTYNKSNSKILFTKFNAEDDKSITDFYKVTKYPTLILFVHGHPIEYFGLNSEESINKFLRNTLNRHPVKITTQK